MSSKFLTESTGEKIVKIGQYLLKMWTKYHSLVFWGPPCIYHMSPCNNTLAKHFATSWVGQHCIDGQHYMYLSVYVCVCAWVERYWWRHGEGRSDVITSSSTGWKLNTTSSNWCLDDLQWWSMISDHHCDNIPQASSCCCTEQFKSSASVTPQPRVVTISRSVKFNGSNDSAEYCVVPVESGLERDDLELRVWRLWTF